MDIWMGLENDQRVVINTSTFRRHMVCLGASGSGKTVLCKVVCEEFIRKKIPVIAVDPQGDISSLIHVESSRILQKKGIPSEARREYADQVEVVIWTPASSVGAPLSLNPVGFFRESMQKDQSYEEVLRSISLASDSITALLGHDLASDDGRLVTGILSIALNYIHEEQLDICNFSDLAGFLSEPTEDFLERLENIASGNDLKNLSRKIRLLTVGVKQLLFELGKPLDIEELLGLKGNSSKTRLSIIYLNTLSSQEEKEFFIARLATALYQWMLANPSEETQALFYIDEIAPFIPPVRKPACKDILKLLYKQARKYGVGCLIASQNPGDIDYKAISQCSTWCLGRLIARQDIKKVEQMLKSLAPTNCQKIVESLPTLGAGKFLLFSPDEFDDIVDLQVRWLITQHQTLDEEQIRSAVPEAVRKKYLQKVKGKKKKTARIEVEDEEEEVFEGDDEEIDTSDNSKMDQILNYLKNNPSCCSTVEIAEGIEVSPATVRRYLTKDDANVKKIKLGKSWQYWHPDYTFYPEYGVTKRVDVAKLQLLQHEAVRLANKRLEKQLVFFEKERIVSSSLYYQPLWQVFFTETIENSFLVFTTYKSKDENIYVDVRNSRICVYNKRQGLELVDSPAKNPSMVLDLDDICTFESVVPNALEGVKWQFLEDIIDENELRKKLAYKFFIEIHRVQLVFLPLWEFKIEDNQTKASRTLFIDGVAGMPMIGVQKYY